MKCNSLFLVVGMIIFASMILAGCSDCSEAVVVDSPSSESEEGDLLVAPVFITKPESNDFTTNLDLSLRWRVDREVTFSWAIYGPETGSEIEKETFVGDNFSTKISVLNMMDGKYSLSLTAAALDGTESLWEGVLIVDKTPPLVEGEAVLRNLENVVWVSGTCSEPCLITFGEDFQSEGEKTFYMEIPWGKEGIPEMTRTFVLSTKDKLGNSQEITLPVTYPPDRWEKLVAGELKRFYTDQEFDPYKISKIPFPSSVGVLLFGYSSRTEWVKFSGQHPSFPVQEPSSLKRSRVAAWIGIMTLFLFVLGFVIKAKIQRRRNKDEEEKVDPQPPPPSRVKKYIRPGGIWTGKKPGSGFE
ncbi:MAG TPA: hypothetical protein PKK07_00120 [bacterium]|nr:hypothetical protein [bacterium]